MLGGQKSFHDRVQMLERAHDRGPKGRVNVVGPDGLIIAQKRRSTPKVPLRGLMYLVVGFALFKAIALAQIGVTGYSERIGALKEGTLLEQAGAVLMQPDRISMAIAAQIAPFIR